MKGGSDSSCTASSFVFLFLNRAYCLSKEIAEELDVPLMKEKRKLSRFSKRKEGETICSLMKIPRNRLNFGPFFIGCFKFLDHFDRLCFRDFFTLRRKNGCPNIASVRVIINKYNKCMLHHVALTYDPIFNISLWRINTMLVL